MVCCMKNPRRGVSGGGMFQCFRTLFSIRCGYGWTGCVFLLGLEGSHVVAEGVELHFHTGEVELM